MDHRALDFGIMFFSSSSRDHDPQDRYGLLLDCARFADAHGFVAVWTPERHFHEFGGIFPNPSVVSAALAMITRRVALRAGSLISPLHHVARIAEEWSVVDNLSGGRVAISFGSGWNVDDFIFFPERYEQRQAVMYRQIEELRALWRGGTLKARNSFGREVELALYPRPVQPELPVWITSSGNPATFASAGAIGANLLTHMIGQDLAALAGKIRGYRDALEQGGRDRRCGKVALMLHTFVGRDLDEVRALVRRPLREYLRAAVSLEAKAAAGGGAISGGHRIAPHHIGERTMEDLLDTAFERYFETASLLGTPDKCAAFLEQLVDVEVDEIACLVDFGVPAGAVVASLELLAELRRSFSPEGQRAVAREAVDGFMEELE